MNQRDFDREIKRLLQRLDLLRAARRGDIQLQPVEVPGHWVSRHWRSDHTRYVAPRRRTSRR